MSIRTALNDIKQTRKQLAEAEKMAKLIKRHTKAGVYATKPELLAEHRGYLAECLSCAAGYAYGFGQSLNSTDHLTDLTEEDSIPSFAAIAEAMTK